MASYNKYEQYVEDVAHKVHDHDNDTHKIMLSNAAPNAGTHSVRADASEISAGNGYTSGGGTATKTSSGQTSGVYKLVLADVVFTASGGSIGPFRYAILYNDTPTSPADPLIGYWDYGSALTLNDGESLTVDLSAANGVFTIT